MFNVLVPTKVPVVLNGLLVSQRLPTIDMKNPVDSLTKVQSCSTLSSSHSFHPPIQPFLTECIHLQIANKAIKLFTTWKLDLTPHVKEVKETLAQIYEKQVNSMFVYN